MTAISGAEKEVLMYLKSSMHHNRFEGVKASEIASNIDRPLGEVIDLCQKLNQTNLAVIEKTDRAGNKIGDLEIHISNKGLDYLRMEKGTPL